MTTRASGGSDPVRQILMQLVHSRDLSPLPYISIPHHILPPPAENTKQKTKAHRQPPFTTCVTRIPNRIVSGTEKTNPITIPPSHESHINISDRTCTPASQSRSYGQQTPS